jgi:hypothetical protein
VLWERRIAKEVVCNPTLEILAGSESVLTVRKECHGKVAQTERDRTSRNGKKKFEITSRWTDADVPSSSRTNTKRKVRLRLLRSRVEAVPYKKSATEQIQNPERLVCLLSIYRGCFVTECSPEALAIKDRSHRRPVRHFLPFTTSFKKYGRTDDNSGGKARH